MCRLDSLRGVSVAASNAALFFSPLHLIHSFEQTFKMELSFSPDNKKSGGFVATVKKDVKIGLHVADKAINSKPGKIVLGVAGNVPGPVGEPPMNSF